MSCGAQRPDLSFASELPLTQGAIDFARSRHDHQRRAADGAPFLVHPLEVASLLERAGYPDEVIASAVLHDILEDTRAESSELEQRFGAEVSRLVLLVTDDPSIADEEARKQDTRERVRAGGGHALALFAADKISKVRELRMLMANDVDPEVAAVKLRRYELALQMLEETIPANRLVDSLRFEIEALRALPPGPQSPDRP